MTILTDARDKLDTAMNDMDATVFMILDEPDDQIAEAVHDKAQQIASPRPWRHVFLVTDATLLKDDELMRWFDEPGHYVVIGGKSKVVAIRGPLADLVLPTGTPIAMKIRTAFNLGDHLK